MNLTARIQNLVRELAWDHDQIDLSYQPFDLSRYRVPILGKVRPRDKKQVIALLKACTKSEISLYVFSKGNNWAFGGPLPSRPDCLLVDLSDLNQIEEFNAEFGVVVIQPGVTQGALGDFLTRENSKYYLDVTGSGRETSVLGNALERGVAYNSLRAERVMFIEVALATGEVIKTGFSAHEDCRVRHLYPFGLGPDSRGLFFQSSLGIVLSMGYQLHLRPEDQLNFHLEVDENKISALIDSIADLKRQGVLDCIVHLADPVRTLSTLAPILNADPQARRSDVEFILNRVSRARRGQKVWSAIGVVSGPRSVVRAKKALLKARLRSTARLKFYREDTIRKFDFLLRCLPRLATTLRVSRPLRGLTGGDATDAATKMVFWSGENKASARSPRPDASAAIENTPFAVIFCVPLAPMNGECAAQLIDVAQKFAQVTQLIVGMTLNTLNASVLEAVVSLHFDPERFSTEKAHAAFLDLNRRYIELGFYPYRLNPGLQLSLRHLITHPDFSAALSEKFDPQGIINPNHYVD